jgi:hypothetical protein
VRRLKKKAAAGSCPRAGLALLGWVLVSAWVAPAYALPRVLVLEPAEAPNRFLVSLQIQLSGIATPERAPAPPAGNAAAQIDAATALARDEGALAAIWTEGVHPVILYVAGEREGRALVEVVRVRGGPGPELERTLALKVREVVAELARSGARAPQEAMLLPPRAAPRPQPSAAARWHPVFVLGARLGSQPRIGFARWGASAGVGPALAMHRLRFAAVAGADWFPVVSVERQGERARFWELAGTLTLHAQLRAGRTWFGLQLGPQLATVHATGTTTAGRIGAARSELLAAVMAGLSAEVSLGASFGLAAELQLQTLLHQQGFSVNALELVDFGRARARLGVALTYRGFGE